MGSNQSGAESEPRDLDVDGTDRTRIVDEDGDAVEIYTIHGKTFLGTRKAGKEDGFAVHIDEYRARIIIGALIRRVLKREA